MFLFIQIVLFVMCLIVLSFYSSRKVQRAFMQKKLCECFISQQLQLLLLMVGIGSFKDSPGRCGPCLQHDTRQSQTHYIKKSKYGVYV